ncbi:hypothetical protein HDU98_008862 [Podochytrium sp. JEL0797]|nr:hypothetical protein HDU98_008862 [Podochytrium sp. JEL0797]
MHPSILRVPSLGVPVGASLPVFEFALASNSQRFLDAQTTALESLATLMRKVGGSLGAKELARSLAAAAALSAHMAKSATPSATLASPLALSPTIVLSHKYLFNPSAQQISFRNSPSLGLDSWKSLASMLKTVAVLAVKVLPVIGGVALVSVLGAAAAHLAGVRIPMLNRLLGVPDRRGVDTDAADVQGLTEEVTALRANLDQYRPLALAGLNNKSDSYAEVAETHIQALEATNAGLTRSLRRVTEELESRILRESILMDHVSSLMKEKADTVGNLERKVDALRSEKGLVEARVEGLERELGELRELFESMAASRASSRSTGSLKSIRTSSNASSVSRISSSEGKSVSRGRRSIAGSNATAETIPHDSDPITPTLSLENSSVWEKSPVGNGGDAVVNEVETAEVNDGDAVSLKCVESLKDRAESTEKVSEPSDGWEDVFDEDEEELKGENVLG